MLVPVLHETQGTCQVQDLSIAWRSLMPDGISLPAARSYAYSKHMQHVLMIPHSSALIPFSCSQLTLVQHGHAAARTLSNIQMRLKAMMLLLSPIMLVGSRVGRRKYCQANLSHPGLSPTCKIDPGCASSLVRDVLLVWAVWFMLNITCSLQVCYRCTCVVNILPSWKNKIHKSKLKYKIHP